MKARDIFQNRQAEPLFLENRHAVLIPIIQVQGEPRILFEKRAASLKTQPGEISFPGGSIEEGESAQEAALRECMEELNLEESHLEIYGETDYVIRRDGRSVRAFVGEIQGIDLEDIQPNPREVDHVFAVPLDFFFKEKPRAYDLGTYLEVPESFPFQAIPGGRDYPWTLTKERIYFYYWQDYVIWGMTAGLTLGLVQILKANGNIGSVTKL